MKIAPVAEVKAKLSEFLQRCQTEPVVITRNGRAAVMLVPITDDEDLERLVLAHTPRFREMLDQAEVRIHQSGGVKHKDFSAAQHSAPKKATRPAGRRGRTSKASSMR